jgi:hypothetical protein
MLTQDPNLILVSTLTEEELNKSYKTQLLNHTATSVLAYLICLAVNSFYTWFACYLNDMNPTYYLLSISTMATKDAWNVSNVTEIYLFSPVLSLFSGAIFYGLYRVTLQSYTTLKLLFLWLAFWFFIRSLGAPFAGAITFKEMGYYVLWNFGASPIVRIGMVFCSLFVSYLIFRQMLMSFYESAPVFDLILSESGDQSRRRKFVWNVITLPCLITLTVAVLAFVPGPTRFRFWLSFTFKHEIFIMIFALFNWLVVFRSIVRFASNDVMLFKNHLPSGIYKASLIAAFLAFVLVRVFHETALF